MARLLPSIVFFCIIFIPITLAIPQSREDIFVPSGMTSKIPPGIARLSMEEQERIIITGNFTIDGKSMNVAQYDISTGAWSNLNEAELYLYGESNGIIWDIAVNSTRNQFGKMFVVGAFDTVTKISQVQYCSMAAWDGAAFEKVGEGLCPRGGDPSTVVHLEAVVIGNGGDLFVGGSFESRVWDGSHFVSVYHVAQFEGSTSSWLPLRGGQLQANGGGSARVNALAWDSHNSILYIGGQFSSIAGEPISQGLAMWTETSGIVEFGGGLSNAHPGVEASVTALALEPKSESLFVSGTFSKVNGFDCTNIAVWHRVSNTWMCLYSNTHSFSSITSIYLHEDILHVAGPAAPESTWSSIGSFSHAIARMEISGYIREKTCTISNHSEVSSPASTSITLNQAAVGPCDLPLKKNVSASASEAPRIGRSNIQRRFENKGGGSAFKSTLTKRRRMDNRSNGSHHRDKVPVEPRATANNSKLMTTHMPSPSPTVPPPWKPSFEWLPGFPGVDNAVMSMSHGSNYFEGTLFIAGAFSNFPSVILWRNDPDKGPKVEFVTASHSVQGLVTVVRQVYLSVQELPDPMDPHLPPKDYTILILVSCILVGMLLGIVFAIVGFYTSRGGYSRIKGVGPNEAEGEEMIALSLKTLSGGANTTVDFKQCFERAMRARHLPAHESLLIINPKEIVLSKIIGEGSFGRVWSGQWHNSTVAVKEFVFAQAAIVGGSIERHNIIEEIVGEAGVMVCLRHPKILQLYGCSLTLQAIWLVSELCSKGSLRMVLNDKSIHLPLIKKISILLDVADGMLYLHTRSPPVIHRDLKSHNIFINEPSPGQFVAKIGDWGSARAVALTGQKSMTHGVGTACWLAPEVINYAYSSKNADVYAFGIIMWECFTRQEVHEGLSAAQIIAKVANEGLRPAVPPQCPWADIMTECWKEDAKERPGFPRIMATLSKMYSKAKSAARRELPVVSSEGAGGVIHEAEVMAGQQRGSSESIESQNIARSPTRISSDPLKRNWHQNKGLIQSPGITAKAQSDTSLPQKLVREAAGLEAERESIENQHVSSSSVPAQYGSTSTEGAQYSVHSTS